MSYRTIYETRWGWTIVWHPLIETQPFSFHCDLEPWEIGQYLGGN